MDVDRTTSAAEPRRVTVLGSTGSIGRSTVDLLQRNPDGFTVEALTGNTNVKLLADQARILKPRVAVVADPANYGALKDALSGTGIEVTAGLEAVVEAAERPSDWVMSAIVGAAGLRPTLAAARRGVLLALANKECLVSAGNVMMREVAHSGSTLLPVDSEHNAIFQVLDGSQVERIEKIILTASGGPFLRRSFAEMDGVSCEQAIAHPNWSMGAKISVDSATLMNKGLELIEAFHLFPVSAERIEVLVHPQSVVHSMVAYVDGSVLAQLGSPDMRTPIAYTLAWPSRMTTPAPRLSLTEIGTLTFEKPDTERFPALRLAREALQTGGSATTILNAANEEAVNSFLERRIGFLDIARIVEGTMERADVGPLETLNDVDAADALGRGIARKIIAQRVTV